MISLTYEDSAWVAKAAACSLQNTDNRPVLGYIVYNLKYLPSKNQESFSNFECDKLIKVTIHEIFHALVFSSSLYQYYVNSSPDQYGTNQQREPFLTFLEVLSFTQLHFGCSEITQVYLEDSGSEGTVGDDITWSGINNALLKDSGQYDVNMDFHDRLFWGKGKGCDFYFRACLSEPKPKEFCDLSNNQHTYTGYNYEGYDFQCKNNKYSDHRLDSRTLLATVLAACSYLNSSSEFKSYEYPKSELTGYYVIRRQYQDIKEEKMITQFPKSIKGKIGTVFIIFNILIAICNLIIILYMIGNYCDTQILTLAVAAFLFGLLNLALLIKDMFWSSGFLHFSVIFDIILCILSIAGVIIINQERFCTLILCTKGVDEINVLSKSPYSRNSNYCSNINQNTEELYLRIILNADYNHTMVIQAAWPLTFGIIQIVLCFIQSIVNFFSLYKFGCPPSKDVRGLQMYD
ncbi:hypothetical protein ABPG72_014628 [Tetrahymena utriculariae]